MAIFGRIITITAGTPQRIVPGRTLVNSITVQGLHAGTGLIYVLSAEPDVTMAKGGVGTALIAELGPATATSGTTPFPIPLNGEAVNQAGGTDLHYFGIDGANSGDLVAVSWDARN